MLWDINIAHSPVCVAHMLVQAPTHLSMLHDGNVPVCVARMPTHAPTHLSLLPEYSPTQLRLLPACPPPYLCVWHTYSPSHLCVWHAHPPTARTARKQQRTVDYNSVACSPTQCVRMHGPALCEAHWRMNPYVCAAPGPTCTGHEGRVGSC